MYCDGCSVGSPPPLCGWEKRLDGRAPRKQTSDNVPSLPLPRPHTMALSKLINAVDGALYAAVTWG
jgi:hypothetical protein